MLRGHKSVVEKHALDVSMQIKEAFGDENFQPIVNIHDAYRTLHDNVNQFILASNQKTKTAKKRLDMACSSKHADGNLDGSFSQAVNQSGFTQALLDDNAEDDCTVLDPEEVTKTLLDLENVQETAGSTSSNTQVCKLSFKALEDAVRFPFFSRFKSKR